VADEEIPEDRAAEVAGLAALVAAELEQNRAGGDREKNNGELAHRELDGRNQQHHPQVRRDDRDADQDAVNAGRCADQGGLHPHRQDIQEGQQREKHRARRTAEQIEDQELAGAPPALHPRAEEEEADRVEKNMSHAVVQELKRDELPDAESINGRPNPERAEFKKRGVASHPPVNGP
jgi:hypothetical protein